ncbi:hypothetical protein C8J57DRAFT_1310600 [Mycena rebaudengoi]|nr:hypothetical protein C8J57DRAFT_1310600 [Mycena rebaudengoi]
MASAKAKVAMLLLDLNYDVLLRIFTYLDIASVLQSARVSSACKKLAQSKHVWLAIVLDLGYRHLLDLPRRDTLLQFSTMQLIEEVKRAVLGPRTWAADSSSVPTVRRKIHLDTSGPGSSPPSEPTLLSGDKHLLVQRGTGCEIWDIAEGRRIWARDGIIRDQVFAQPVHDGTELLIVLCTGQPQIWELTLDPALLNCKLLVQVFLLDLKTNLERQMPPIQLPRTCTEFSDPVIADNIWCATIKWFVQNGDFYKGVFLVNWRETKFVLLHHSVQLLHKNILCGHLLALTGAGSKSDVVLYPSASFDPHWELLDSILLARIAHSPVRIKPIFLQRVEYPELPGFRPPRMSVHECLLHHGSYLVSTYNASVNRLPPDSEKSRRPALHRYRLTLWESTLLKPTWERISCTGTINCVLMDSFTYSGYGLSFSPRAPRLAPRFICRPATGESTVDGTWTVPLPEVHPDCVCLSPDTGALTVCSARGVNVYYYE